jgi:hypothetical protein
MAEARWLDNVMASAAKKAGESKCRWVNTWMAGEKIANRGNGTPQYLPDGDGGTFCWFGNLADPENDTRVAHFWFKAKGTTMHYGLTPSVSREKVLGRMTDYARAANAGRDWGGFQRCHLWGGCA